MKAAIRAACARGICLALALVGGCSTPESIPKYPLMPARQTLDLLREHSAAIRHVSGQGSLRMTRGDGQSIILDAVVVIASPDRARVRAWKFGQAVFDLTVVPEGVYLFAPNETSRREQIAAAGSSASNMIRGWLRLLAGSFDAADVDEHGDEIIVRQQRPDDMTLISTIDRKTITARSYRLLDAGGQQRFSISLSRFIESSGQVWPTRIDAVSPDGEMRLDLREVEVNGEVPDGAFNPPGRAEKLP